MAFLLAALAAAVNALTSVLQRIGVETAPASSTLRLSLMAHALRRGIWLVGFALMLVVFGLQATALRFGSLTIVQPVLTTELLFLFVILAVWFRYRLHWPEWVGAATAVGGLAIFFLAADPKGGRALPSEHGWLLTYIVLGSAIAACILSALRGPRWWRAAAFGASASLTAAFTAALTKAITTYVTEGWGHVFVHAQPYLLAICGIGTVFLIQNALHAGPITASRITMITINPVVSIVLGISLFGDRLRNGPGWITLETLGLAALVVGVVVLARSPLVASTRAGGDSAGPEEMLGGARERAALAGVEAVVAMDPGTID